MGLGAHDWGRPVENLADDRFLGTPETAVLFYGSIVSYARQFGCTMQSVRAIVGLTQSAFTQEGGSDVVSGVRSWLIVEHAWQVEDEDTPDVEAFDLSVQSADVTSQAAAAMFDYFLDDRGTFIPTRKPDYKKEIGIVSIGMNTLELLVIRNGAPVERFLTSETAGVRRLLDIIDPAGLYSRGELDTQLRAGKLNYREAIPAWASEVGGHIERGWGNAYRRFATTIVTGGGALLLGDALTARFDGKSFSPDNPIMSVARGLYKLGRMKQNRNRCPCVDHPQVEAYWEQVVDEHTLLPAQWVVPSTLVPQVAPSPALVRAIRRRGELVFPLVVRPWEHGKRERYEVVASHEVYSAAREAGLDRLPVIIKRRLTDEQALELIREIRLYTGAGARLCEESDQKTGVIRFPDRLRPDNSNHATKAESSKRTRVAG